jgi:hypothetical protein
MKRTKDYRCIKGFWQNSTSTYDLKRQNPLSKLPESLFNQIKHLYEKLTADTIFNGKKLNTYP